MNELKPAKTFVVLTNYNGVANQFLPYPCLTSLERSLVRADKEGCRVSVIIVEDRSQDDSLKVIEEFQKRSGQVSIMRNQTEAEWDVTKSLNGAISRILTDYSECEFVITFDNDIALSEEFLLRMVQEAETCSVKIGMIASNQFVLDEFRKGTKTHRSTGHYIDRAGATRDRDYRCEARNRGKKILCPCLSGALLKTKMLKEIGLIDEDYYHYNNCSELGLRAQLKDWEVKLAPAAVMWHRDRGSIPWGERRRDIEISRIWNILRFFPTDRIDESLEAYKKQHSKTVSPDKKAALVEEARRKCPPIFESDKKGIVYREFVEANS